MTTVSVMGLRRDGKYVRAGFRSSVAAGRKMAAVLARKAVKRKDRAGFVRVDVWKGLDLVGQAKLKRLWAAGRRRAARQLKRR